MKENGVENKKRKKSFKTLFKLFYSSLYISAVAFGGGFVVLSLLRETFVKKLSWVTDGEMSDFNALAQTSPGSIAINTAMLVGLKTAGITGMIFTLLGSVIPPMAVITALYYFYDAIKDFALVAYLMRGMQAGVAAVIFSLVIDTWKSTFKEKSVFAVTVLLLSFSISTVCSVFLNLSVVIYAVILSALAGIAFSYFNYFRERKGDKEKGE